MPRALPSALIFSAALACGAAHGAEPTVLALEIEDGASVVELVWRDGDAIFVSEDVLAALNLRAPAGGAPYALSAVPGLKYDIEEENALVRIHCTARCYRLNQLTGRRGEHVGEAEGEPISAVIFNYDVVTTVSDDDVSVAGAFETSWVAPRLAFESEMAARGGDDSDVVRLDTAMTFDMPARRARLRIGDAVSRAGAWGLPTRFGGVKFGTDLSIAPNFVSYETPALSGESALPASVDLYVDGALRMRGAAPAGPFSIEDAPVTTGAGVARVVVTDVLGREQVITTPFYVSPMLLKAGLTDYAIDVGAVRRGYGVASADYSGGFASITVRRGLGGGLTGEARVETARDAQAYGLALTGATHRLGQLEVAAARSESVRGAGDYTKTAWSRVGTQTNFAASYEMADANFTLVGASETAPPRGRAFASAGLSFGDAGLSLAATRLDARDGGVARTLSATATYDFGRATALLTVLSAESDDGEGGFALSLALSMPIGDRGYASASAETRDGRVRGAAYAARPAPSRGGMGWRARATSDERVDAGVSFLHAAGVAEADFSQAGGETGVRLHAAGGAVFADGALFATRAVDQSFAVVRAEPGVEIAVNNRAVGRADKHGRMLATGLTPYTEHRVSFDPTEATLDLQFDTDVIRVAPQGRAGVTARFAMRHDEARWLRVFDRDGAPMARGVVFTRESDGARFFVGDDGLAYVGAPAGMFKALVYGEECVIDVHASDDVRCRS